MEILYTNAVGRIEEIDAQKGIVKFRWADFNSIDSQNRRMSPKAFNRTIKNNFKRIKHLQNHNPDRMIGKILELYTDDKGAVAVSQLSKNTAGQDMLMLYNEGIMSEHSFAFNILKSHDEDGVEVVDEARVWEVSSVTWGSNENTPTLNVNSEQLNNIKILNKLDEIALALSEKNSNSQASDTNVKETLEYIKQYKF